VKRSSTLLLAFALLACAKEEQKTLTIQTVPVTRQTIVLDATASGAIEPINIVEVKSKSSGQIVRMPVETGSEVKPGDLLVQLETRDVQNQYDQAQADLNAAEAKLAVSDAQKKRSDGLFAQRIVTAQEPETAQLDFANSQAQVIRARTSLDQAQQRLDDATALTRRGCRDRKDRVVRHGDRVGHQQRERRHRSSRWRTSARSACAPCSTRRTSAA
jgi:multidrug efflux pump subunit AcrA (membrane-fusion protein)